MTFEYTGFEASKLHEAEWALYNHLNMDLQWSGQEVTHVSDADRTVRIAPGSTRIKGVFIRVTEAHDVQADANAHASNSRIDALIWRVDWPSKTVTVLFKKGTVASVPQPPSLTQTVNDRWEEPIRYVTVGPGQGAFTSGSIAPAGLPLDVPWESQAAMSAWTVRSPGVIWRARRNGTVFLKGALYRGSSSNVWLSDSHMFTLPQEWRPAETIYGVGTQVWNEQQWFRITLDAATGEGVVRVAGDEAIRSTLFQFTFSYPVF